MIVASSIVFNSVVQRMQWVGYSVAFVGIMMYTHYKFTQYTEKTRVASEEIGGELELLRDDSNALSDGEDEEVGAVPMASPASSTPLRQSGSPTKAEFDHGDPSKEPLQIPPARVLTLMSMQRGRSFAFASPVPTAR